MSNEILIREVCDTDVERLVEIYDHYVVNTAVTFEYYTPTVEEFRKRISVIGQKYPYLVCEMDGRIIGYAYASEYSSREAFNWSVYTSIYLDKNYRRLGAGTALYECLEEELKDRGIVNAIAAVAYIEEEDEYLTNDSVAFHERKGYVTAAHMKNMGKKFDRWYDLLLMQKVL